MTYEEFRATPRLLGLDGLRGISALLVISGHMHDEIWRPLGGTSGVDIFFVLSGFLITSLLLREEEENGAISLLSFYIRRSFRILPAYYVVLSIYVVLLFVIRPDSLADKTADLTQNIWLYLFYMNEFQLPGSTTFGHSWSLGVEEKFYLLWPWLSMLLLTTMSHRLLVTALSAVAFLTLHHFVPDISSQIRFDGYGELLLGAVLAMLLQERRSYGVIALLGRNDVALGVAGAFIAVHLLKHYFAELKILYPFFIFLLIASAVTGRSLITRVLETDALKFLGGISYGIYLVHVLSLNAAQLIFAPGSNNWVVSTGALVLAIVISVSFAYGLQLVVERPLRVIGRNLAKRRMIQN